MVGQPGTAPEHKCNDRQQQWTSMPGGGSRDWPESPAPVSPHCAGVPRAVYQRCAKRAISRIVKWADGKLRKLSSRAAASR